MVLIHLVFMLVVTQLVGILAVIREAFWLLWNNPFYVLYDDFLRQREYFLWLGIGGCVSCYGVVAAVYSPAVEEGGF